MHIGRTNDNEKSREYKANYDVLLKRFVRYHYMVRLLSNNY